MSILALNHHFWWLKKAVTSPRISNKKRSLFIYLCIIYFCSKMRLRFKDILRIGSPTNKIKVLILCLACLLRINRNSAQGIWFFFITYMMLHHVQRNTRLRSKVGKSTDYLRKSKLCIFIQRDDDLSLNWTLHLEFPRFWHQEEQGKDRK